MHEETEAWEFESYLPTATEPTSSRAPGIKTSCGMCMSLHSQNTHGGSRSPTGVAGQTAGCMPASAGRKEEPALENWQAGTSGGEGKPTGADGAPQQMLMQFAFSICFSL